jgi:hypothetical protein
LRTIIRRLSSNNKSRTGIISLIHTSNENDFNIWSEKYWSELGKQFNKSIDFPLPGQTGTVLEMNHNNKILNDTNSNNTNTTNIVCENLNYLLNKPLAQENQINKLKEAVGSIYYQDKLESDLFSNEEKNALNFEMKAYKCPKSLILGWFFYWLIYMSI